MKFQLAVVVPLGLSVLAAVAISQNVTRSASDGIYTAEQAKRGKASFETNCAVCHGDQLDGSESAPSLSGDDFTLAWGGHTVGELVDRIHNTMPPDHPGTISRDEATGIAAYVLSVNKFPAGTAELTSDEEQLKQIRIDATASAK
jgi:mono/diheme cytochrome c family protein